MSHLYNNREYGSVQDLSIEDRGSDLQQGRQSKCRSRPRKVTFADTATLLHKPGNRHSIASDQFHHYNPQDGQNPLNPPSYTLPNTLLTTIKVEPDTLAVSIKSLQLQISGQNLRLNQIYDDLADLTLRVTVVSEHINKSLQEHVQKVTPIPCKSCQALDVCIQSLEDKFNSLESQVLNRLDALTAQSNNQISKMYAQIKQFQARHNERTNILEGKINSIESKQITYSKYYADNLKAEINKEISALNAQISNLNVLVNNYISKRR